MKYRIILALTFGLRSARHAQAVPMLTKLRIQNFKQFDDVLIPLEDHVVFVGPNNSGKSTALQALALWYTGLSAFTAKYGGTDVPPRRPTVTLSRQGIVAVPVATTKSYWHNLKPRQSVPAGRSPNVLICVTVDGVTDGEAWSCGLEFDYANPESLYCRPLRLDQAADSRMPIPLEAAEMTVVLLPPMGGLVSSEVRVGKGAVAVRLGEGRTGEVLRNLCLDIYEKSRDDWERIANAMDQLFGMRPQRPILNATRGEVELSYVERGCTFELTSGGRGAQQVLLILAYLHRNRRSVLLLDEPDAHLEVLRQEQVYQLMCETAHDSGSQVIAATHSEVVLQRAADSHSFVAFVGKPHAVAGNRLAQVRKALRQFAWIEYYKALTNKWVLYLEGQSDLDILRKFADRLEHAEARRALSAPFLHTVGNVAKHVRDHFYAMREALPGLRGLAILDEASDVLGDEVQLEWHVWDRCEIENYVLSRHALLAFANGDAEDGSSKGTLFATADADEREMAMKAVFNENRALMRVLDSAEESREARASADVLPLIFDEYYTKLGKPNRMPKRQYYRLVIHMPVDQIAQEIHDVLDRIAAVAAEARNTELGS